MRVVLDGRIILPRMSGAGRYVVELARRLPRLDSNLQLNVLLLPVLQRTGIPALLEDAGARVVYGDARVLSIRQWAVVPWVLRRLRPDLYHYPHFDLPYVPFPSVVTIYDLNPALLPGYFTRQPELRRMVARRLVHSTLRRCRIAMVISETVRRLMVQHFSEARGKVRTVRMGVDPTHWAPPGVEGGGGGSGGGGAPAEPSAGERSWGARPYVLYVGVERPHKNLVRLVRAFVRFRGSAQWSPADAPYLWLAGVGAGSQELRNELQRLGCADSVRLTDALTETALVRAYRQARVVAFVSISEGFGLPILEALAAGVPLVAGNASCLPEVAGDAAMYVAPEDEGDIARGLTETWWDETLRRSLVERGARRVAEFSWEDTARESLQAYRDALSQGR
jgi:glycosyltransferase involved in cell wall biosynthesis